MRLGAVSAVNSIPKTPVMSAARIKHTQHSQRTQSVDIVGKKLQNEITDKQQQKNGLSSNANISAQEKSSKSIELQQGISNLKAQLKRHEIETDREQDKQDIPAEDKTAGIREELAKEAEAKAAKEEARKEELKKAEEASEARKERLAEEAESSEKANQDAKSLIASNEAKDQISERNSVIARTEAGIVIKKGEMRQDEIRGEDTKNAQDDINAQEKRLRFMTNITLGPKGINNGSGGMKASNYGIQMQDQNRSIVHEGSDGIVLFKAG